MYYRVPICFILILLVLSACSPSPIESSTEILATAISQESPETIAPSGLLIWESNDLPCQTTVFSSGNLSYGECGKSLTVATPQTTAHAPRFAEISDLFTSFTARTPAGSLIFKGSGNSVPTTAEKRAIAEWAKLMYEVARAGRAGASWSLAFAWHREGGVGGFCDDVAVYLSGLVIVSDCKGFNAQTYLTASQLEQLYGWIDQLSNIDYDDSNAPVADGMKITLVLTGNGSRQADEQTIRDLLDFAATLDAQLGYAATPAPEVDGAHTALTDYLVALHTGNYGLGAELYGGETSQLQTWNPDIANDLPTLLKLACTQNGLRCLDVRSITFFASEVDGHHFWVEFNNKDGTLFQVEACCGATKPRLVSRFPFFVEKRMSGYFVMDLPPYVP